MKIAGKVVVVTGATSGIGLALAERFKVEGAETLVLAARSKDALGAVAKRLGAIAVPCDVTREDDVKALVARAEAAGPIALFVSNVGILQPGTEDAPDSEWRHNWNLHVMAHVYAARAVMPLMTARGTGYFVMSASAAGLLAQVHAAAYMVTKRAAIALGEYLAIKYGDAGIRVSVIASQTVRTPMVAANQSFLGGADKAIIEPAVVADSVVAGIEAERFLILPHPEVLDYFRRKMTDYDRWLAGMRRWRSKINDRA